MKRTSRVDRLTTLWMVTAVFLIAYTMVFGGSLPQQWWTVVHVVTLGVITNSILQWTWYFTRSLLRLPKENKHAGAQHAFRQILFNVLLLLLVAAMWFSSAIFTVILAALIAVVIAWHALALILAAKAALATRFIIVIRYYTAAALLLVVGAIYAGFVAVAMFDRNAPDWIVGSQSNLTLAHSLVNSLGWFGFTIAATLITLGPTMLRTRLNDQAVGRSIRALPYLVVSTLALTAAVTFGLLKVAGLAALLYAVVMAWAVGIPLTKTALTRAPYGYPTWNASAGILWCALGLALLAASLFNASSAEEARTSLRIVVAVLGVGGVLQILTGALTYLMPVVIGGGPSALKVGIAALETFGSFRIALRNAGLVLAILGGEGVLVTLGVALVVSSFLLDLVAFSLAGIAQGRKKRETPALQFPTNVNKTVEVEKS